MFNFFGKNKVKPTLERTKGRDGNGMLTLRHDAEVKASENIPMVELSSKISGLPIFKGVVKYLYESDFTQNKDTCPRCGGELVRMISNFAYATQSVSRLMTGPYGLFCQSCPTAVVDDDFMRDTVDHNRFVYGGVFSIETGYDGVKIIEELNGEKPIFILSEDQDILGIAQSVNLISNEDDLYVDPALSFDRPQKSNAIALKEAANAARKAKAKKKAKSKAAKQSKKANRKK